MQACFNIGLNSIEREAMQLSKKLTRNNLMHCKCGLCNHKSRESCINGHCYCCDLEDMFSILSQHEFESPQSKIVTKEHLNQIIHQ